MVGSGSGPSWLPPKAKDGQAPQAPQMWLGQGASTAQAEGRLQGGRGVPGRGRGSVVAKDSYPGLPLVLCLGLDALLPGPGLLGICPLFMLGGRVGAEGQAGASSGWARMGAEEVEE